MAGRKWTDEQRKAMSANRKAAWAAMTNEQKTADRLAKTEPKQETPKYTPGSSSLAAPKVDVQVSHPETGMAVPKKVPRETPAAEPVLEPTPQAPPRNLFSGTIKKLDVFGLPGTDPNKPVPGHELYWFDDIEGGMIIQQAKASGWVLVRKDEVALNDANTSPGNNDLGGNVRRWVSQGPDGSAIYSYLMKKPDWLYQLHLTGPDSLEQRVHQVQEQQLRRGTYNVNPNERRYSANNPIPGAPPTGLPPITIGSFKH